MLRFEQPIANESADAQRPSAGVANRRCDPPRLLIQIHTDSI